MEHTGFGRLVESRTQQPIQRMGVFRLLGGDCRKEFPFQRVQSGFNRFVVRLPTKAGARLFCCGTCFGHDSVSDEFIASAFVE